MRGTKAKRIRREVYGDDSLRIKREYEIIEGPRKWSGRFKTIRNAPGSLRALYQKAKKAAS